MNFQLIVDVIARAGRLFALALAPALLPPEPAPFAQPNFEAALVLLAFVAVIVAALRFRKQVGLAEATTAASLIIGSVGTSLLAAMVFRDARAPLGQGIIVVAVPLWLGLAFATRVVWRRRFPDQPPSKAKIAAIVVCGVGLAQLVASSTWLFSTNRMWWVTLVRGGDGQRALQALVKTNREPSYAKTLIDGCITTNPKQCFCLAKRSDLRARALDFDGALVDARAAIDACPADASAQVALVVALVSKGEAKQAEEVARAALAQSADPLLDYALAVALQGQGRTQEAMASARLAVEQGAGRDAQLFLAALAILNGDLDTATNTLDKLLSVLPNDAEARYNLALIADKKNDYNRAREGYLAALKADPTLANARYNLALLTLRRGVVDEARHHAQKFAEMVPGDPRIADLMRRIDASKSAHP